MGTFLLVTSAILTILSCNQLFSAAAASTTVGILRGSLAPPSYQIVALRTLGPLAKLVAEIAISALLFGICISYFVIIGEIGPELLKHLFMGSISLSIPSWLVRFFILAPLTYGIALPLSLQPDFSGQTLFIVNATALTAYLLLAARIVMGALIIAPHSISPSILLTVNAIHPLSLLPSVSIFILSLSCQFQLLSLCAGENPLSVVDARLAAKVAVILATILYWSIGVFGYIALLLVASQSSAPNLIPGDIFLTINQLGFIDDLLKLGFMLALVAGFPLMVLPIRSCAFTMSNYCRARVVPLPMSKNASTESLPSISGPTPHFIRNSTIAILTLCLLFAVAFPDMEFVLQLTGATAGICVCYILPSLMYAFAMRKQMRVGGVHDADSPPHRFQKLRLYMAYAMVWF